MTNIYNVIIIGSGPAGYTAAIYTSRALLKPLLITGELEGGQLLTTTEVENYPGYVNGISGLELMNTLYKQAERFGTTFINDSVESIEKNTPFKVKLKSGDIFLSHSIIIATGASPLWLNAENEKKLKSNGISTCAVCDGAFFKDEDVIVIGGGDSAMEEAIFLTKYASKVTIIHRRDEFKASKIMLKRAQSNPKIEWKTNFFITKWVTNSLNSLCGALIQNTKNGEIEKFECTGAFIAIGHTPNTKFLDNQIETNSEGYIILKENMMTSVPGIFACGDVSESSQKYKQAITAAGEGCRAAIDCEKWLEKVLYLSNH
jgi:thioredoxin reductase (NADPH)